ncbi:unnamed protein product [Rhizophagus irregularis]|nr:unnamed protein product [Rhizophagus irregularis]
MHVMLLLVQHIRGPKITIRIIRTASDCASYIDGVSFSRRKQLSQIIHCKIGGSYNHWNHWNDWVTLNIMAFDPWPKQPTRPISCTYCSFDKGKVVCIIKVTSDTFIPIPNADVADIILIIPFFHALEIKHLPGLLITFMFGLSKTVSILVASSGEHVAVNASKGTEGKSCF